ncbi:ArnT family glycosyltransferase [Thiomicrorhabdus aquaedulcis]|uniref:ArnT family glycosyltransferase n=1 Tax=Thiomicrorhabdus aquaedulcis TaxID=2211106 RepID=UPI001562ACD4|nr:glycosyltransferase family 39 protein [Thiomicrorhabdus aquaedulcis]
MNLPTFKTYLSSLTPARASVGLVGFMTLLHFIVAFYAELGGDEAHYALYGLHPDWSYYDHPPMVGWLQIIPMWLAPYDWSARLVPIGLYVALNALLYRLTLTLFGQATDTINTANANLDQAWSGIGSQHWLGFWSLALLNSTLILALMGMAMLPDNPLMVIVLALILVVIKLLKHTQAPLRYWVLLGALVGLAALSKYTAVTLVVSLLAVMLVQKRLDWLTQKGLWLAIATALLMISPILYWNATHDWASILYQINHGTGASQWRLSRLMQTQATQFITYTPLLFLLGWWAMLRLKHYQTFAPRLLLLFSLPITLLFAWGSGYEKSLPHWLSLAWLLLIPIVVHSLWQMQTKKWLKPLVSVHLVVSFTLVLVAHSLLFSPWLAFKDHQNPIQGDYGWPQATQTALTLQAQLAQNPAELPLFVSNWSVASHLAWYARPQPVYLTDVRATQYDYWFNPPAPGSNGLLVVPHYEPVPPKTNQAHHFERCELRQTQDMKVNGAIVVSYYFYHCFNLLKPALTQTSETLAPRALKTSTLNTP